MALADELRTEIERIARQIERLEGERDALRRVLARTSAEPAPAGNPSPPARPMPLREAVVACVAEAGPDGIRMVQIVTRLQVTLPWTPASIRNAAYRLRAEGYLLLEGHLWKPGAPL